MIRPIFEARAEIKEYFCSVFGGYKNKKNGLWNLLTFIKRQWGSYETLTVHIFLLTQTQQPITKLCIQNQFGCLALELVIYSRKTQTQFKWKRNNIYSKWKVFWFLILEKNEMRKKGLSPMSVDALKIKYVVSSLLKTSITVCEKKSKVFW